MSSIDSYKKKIRTKIEAELTSTLMSNLSGTDVALEMLNVSNVNFILLHGSRLKAVHIFSFRILFFLCVEYLCDA